MTSNLIPTLEYLSLIKEDIRNAITFRGGIVTGGVPFEQWGDVLAGLAFSQDTVQSGKEKPSKVDPTPTPDPDPEPILSEYTFTINGQPPDVMTSIGTFNEVNGTFTGKLWRTSNIGGGEPGGGGCNSDASCAWYYAHYVYRGDYNYIKITVENLPVTLCSAVVPTPEPEPEPISSEYIFTIDGQRQDVMTGRGIFNEATGTFTGYLWDDSQWAAQSTVTPEDADRYLCGSDAECAWVYGYNYYGYNYDGRTVEVENLPVTLYSEPEISGDFEIYFEDSWSLSTQSAVITLVGIPKNEYFYITMGNSDAFVDLLSSDADVYELVKSKSGVNTYKIKKDFNSSVGSVTLTCMSADYWEGFSIQFTSSLLPDGFCVPKGDWGAPINEESSRYRPLVDNPFTVGPRTIQRSGYYAGYISDGVNREGQPAADATDVFALLSARRSEFTSGTVNSISFVVGGHEIKFTGSIQLPAQPPEIDLTKSSADRLNGNYNWKIAAVGEYGDYLYVLVQSSKLPEDSISHFKREFNYAVNANYASSSPPDVAVGWYCQRWAEGPYSDLDAVFNDMAKPIFIRESVGLSYRSVYLSGSPWDGISNEYRMVVEGRVDENPRNWFYISFDLTRVTS